MQNVCWSRVASALTWTLCLGLAGCQVPFDEVDSRRGGDADLSMTMSSFDMTGVDLAQIPGGIGRPCTTDNECMFGTTKKCWKQNILEEPGNLATPGGYCTTQCTKDDDCAGQGICVSVAAGQPKYCLQKCASSNVCRHPDYACFVLSSTSGYCWPATRLSCNPTSGDGACQGSDPPAACIRRAFEDLGECRQVCSLGPNTCPFLQNGRRQHCVYINATRDTQGLPTRDKYKGTACFELYNDAKMENAGCAYFDECQDGLQCNLSPMGDRKCRTLCQVGVVGAGLGALERTAVPGALLLAGLAAARAGALTGEIEGQTALGDVEPGLFKRQTQFAGATAQVGRRLGGVERHSGGQVARPVDFDGHIDLSHAGRV